MVFSSDKQGQVKEMRDAETNRYLFARCNFVYYSTRKQRQRVSKLFEHQHLPVLPNRFPVLISLLEETAQPPRGEVFSCRYPLRKNVRLTLCEPIQMVPSEGKQKLDKLFQAETISWFGKRIEGLSIAETGTGQIQLWTILSSLVDRGCQVSAIILKTISIDA